MVILPDQYVVEKFCQYGGYPKYNKRANSWMAGCPICREGSSWGKKRRLYYKLDKNYIFCFNCGWKGNSLNFIKHITGMTFSEIATESGEYTTDNVIEQLEQEKPTRNDDTPPLPDDSINLYEQNQISYWLSTGTPIEKKVVADAVSLLNKRFMYKAINRPKTLWLSLTDYIHKNRIIIPFYSTDGKIIFYQTRSIYEKDKPKYLSKAGGGKTIFNINQIDSSLESVFLFEGPIDSCFVKNGLAVAGITNGPGEDLTNLQSRQLEDLRLYNKIWVLDSQWLDKTSLTKTKLLIDQGHTVFIWPESIGKQYKDLNDLCVSIDKPGIGHKFIEKNSFAGLKAKLMLKNIN
jgi:hypothetical protein